MADSIQYSIIIPTYCRESLLLEAVSSVINAEPNFTEIIIVNDGLAFSESTVDRLKRNNIKILKTQGAVGPAEARNIGARSAQGHFLFFLDDDDVVMPSYWRQLVDKLLINADVDDLIYGFSNIEYVRNRSTLSEKMGDAHYDFMDIGSAKGRSRLAGFGAGFWISKKLFFDVECIDSNLKINEDTDFCLKLIKSSARCIYTKNVGVLVYSGDRGVGNSSSVTRSCTAVERFNFLSLIIQNHAAILIVHQDISFWLWSRCVHYAAKIGNWNAFFQLIGTNTLKFISKIPLSLKFVFYFLVNFLRK